MIGIIIIYKRFLDNTYKSYRLSSSALCDEMYELSVSISHTN